MDPNERNDAVTDTSDATEASIIQMPAPAPALEQTAPDAGAGRTVVKLIGLEQRALVATLANVATLEQQAREASRLIMSEIIESLKSRGVSTPADGQNVSLDKDAEGKLSSLSWETLKQ